MSVKMLWIFIKIRQVFFNFAKWNSDEGDVRASCPSISALALGSAWLNRFSQNIILPSLIYQPLVQIILWYGAETWKKYTTDK